MITYFHEVWFTAEPSFIKNLDCVPPIDAGVAFKGKFFRVEDVHLSLDKCEYHVLLKEIENGTERTTEKNMEPNEQQKRICDLIKSQVSFWQSTNDIHSPTHYNDIETEIDSIEGLNENEKCQLIYIMQTLYDFVKVIEND